MFGRLAQRFCDGLVAGRWRDEQDVAPRLRRPAQRQQVMLAQIDAVDFQRARVFEARGTAALFQIVREAAQVRILHLFSLARRQSSVK